MADHASVTGACLCRAIQFELDLPTKFVAHCHCNSCRRAHGAPLVTWAGVLEGQFRITAGADQLQRYQSSAGVVRSFCQRCGTTLLFQGERWAGEVHVAAANIDGELDRAPAAHVYYGDKASWFEVPDQLPKLGGDSGIEPLK